MANIRQFNKIANNYQSELRLTLFELFKVELIELGINGRVLDFGCGTGNLGISIANQCDSVCLLEPSAAMREIIHQKVDSERLDNCYVIDVNLEAEEKLQTNFDYIIVAQVLLHIPEYLPLIKQLAYHLNSNGHLIIFDYLKNEQVQSDIVHNGFDLERLKIDIESFGLSTISSRIIYQNENLLLGGDGQLFMLDMQK